jgi:maltose O-acetyltransferase
MIDKLLRFLLHKKNRHKIDKLIKMGLDIGSNCHISPTVRFDESHCWLITIGNDVTIAPNAHILAHDASTKRKLGYTKIGLVNIEDNVFIGAGVIILPGVTIGKHSIIGAGSVVSKDVSPNVVCTGDPAKAICNIEEYLEKHKKRMAESPRFGEEYTVGGGITKKQNYLMRENLSRGIGYIV